MTPASKKAKNMASAEPQDEEPIATPNSMGGLYEAMKLLHARTDNRVERALAAQSEKLEEKIGRLDAGVQT